ncbi:hypothetical protein [Pseudomonas mucidolens]|uniref:Uncharacterized protein n=1 Tax=Pseudomonas mucidolens TaxID=46679 RepID=A0A1H2MMC8_9PSED|nr:hypothetical protein [Pseudomonas mucidolens]SDU94383.1 hypothetical protein SAMN05216202_2010 [Pseudomonas mucidolens]SQH33585.1 Uncharacterised protein [Pseudomonas mucidolens]
MSFPLTPQLSDGQANQPSSGQAPATPQVSRRIEDLDPPYSAYPAVDLTAALYPEAGIWGMGIRHVDSHARWVFEKWFNWNLNDYYAIHLNDPNNPAAADITQDDRARYELFVPKEHVPEGEISVFGRLLRVASNQESTSPPQIYLIKSTRPGGTDRDPGCEWHTGLVMNVEGFPEGAIVNPENTRDGVWCLIERYEHVRKNDVIELSWDGIFVQHTVSPAEAAEAGAIRVFVSKAIIDQGGQLGELTLRFRVRDVVGNFSGEKYQYSKAYTLNSELDPSLLSPPIFLIDGAESTQVDFDAQAESTFEVLALTPRQFPAPVPSYKIAVTLFATLADGTHQAFPLPEVIDENLGVTYVTIARETIGSLVGGSFRVSFQWLKPDSSALSGSTTVTVIGTLVLMPAVTVAPIELGMIDPDHDVTVTLPHYQPHNKDWLETLVIEYRQPGGGSELYTQPQLADVQGGIRTVTKETLQRFNGLGTVYFYYQVNDGAARDVGSGTLEIRKSQEFAAQVGERIAEMPVPILQGVQGNNINPADVPGPSVLLTLPYTGTLTGDLIHWNCIGSGIDGSLSNTIQINGGTAGQPLVFPVDRLILDNNLNGSLRISYSLQRTEPLLTLRSEVLNLTVGIGVQLERPVVEEAQPSSDQLDPLAALDGAHVRVQYQPMLVTD